MALANYFDKNALSAAGLLQGFSARAFRDRVAAQTIGIAWDRTAARSPEGRALLHLLISLLARLYPALALVPLGAAGRGSGSVRRYLAVQARQINRQIEITEDFGRATAVLVVGTTSVPHAAPRLYLGSDGWVVRTSDEAAVGCGSTRNPFGAGAAACLGSAFVFRSLFADQLPPWARAAGAESVSFSLLDPAAPSPESLNPSLPATIMVAETFLLGVGAIGNGAVWALARLRGLSGELHLVDPEALDLSNIQRYVLAGEAHVGEAKVALAARQFESVRGQRGVPASGRPSALRVLPTPTSWQSVVAQRVGEPIDRVLLALDSARDRIAAQASLPRWVVNAWTQPENLGVSRHPSFLGPQACVACLYLPTGARKSEDELVAEAIGLPEPEYRMRIRELLYTGRPVGREFLELLSTRWSIPIAALLPHEQASLREFYAQAVCGGVLLVATPGTSGAVAEVPMAFQSAFAGILLAAELVADLANLRSQPLPVRSEFNLLRPPSALIRRPHLAALKHASGRCICQDADYQRTYRLRHPSVHPAR